MSSDTIEQHYSSAQVAKKFNVKPETIRDWISSGYIKAVKINNRWRVPHSELVRIATEKYGDKK